MKKNIEFNDIINTGAYFKNKYYYIYYKDNGLDISKFGLAVSKKCGNAVMRNKLKRQLRSIIDANKDIFFEGVSYIIMVRKSILDITYKQMEEYLKKLLVERKNNEKN